MRKELYKFTEGTTTWLYTSSDQDETYLGDTYLTGYAIGRNEIQTKSQLTKANCDISMSLDNPIVVHVLGASVQDVLSLTIFSMVDGGNVQVEWKGRLIAPKPATNDCVLSFESIFSSMRRPGLRGVYQLGCRHVHYGRGCNLVRADFEISATVTSIDATGTLLVVPEAGAFPDGTFRGGIITGPDGNLRYVIEHLGSSIMLIRNLDSIPTPLPGVLNVKLAKGCPRTLEVCNGTFNNLDNFGGFPYTPFTSPVGGAKIA